MKPFDFEGRTKLLRGPHAARGPRVGKPCNKVYIVKCSIISRRQHDIFLSAVDSAKENAFNKHYVNELGQSINQTHIQEGKKKKTKSQNVRNFPFLVARVKKTGILQIVYIFMECSISEIVFAYKWELHSICSSVCLFVCHFHNFQNSNLRI